MQLLAMGEINQYSKTLARQLNEFFFIDHTYITGKQIVEFSEIKQINLLIIKNIFEKWQFEKSQWQKSPFFAYQHPEVQKALLNLQNTLSNQIEINKENFYHLLLEAIQDTLILILDPERFLQNEIFKMENTRLQVSDFEGIRRFIEINKRIFQEFMLKINNFPSLSPTETSKNLKDVCANFPPDDIYTHIRRFDALLPLSLEKISPNFTQNNTQNNIQNNTNLIKKDFFEKNIEEIENKLEVQHRTAEFKKQIFASLPKNNAEEQEDIDFLPNTLHEKIAKNTQHQTRNQTTLLEKLGKEKQKTTFSNKNIATMLSINERFLFANALFAGNTLDFNEALDKIMLCDVKNDAEKILYQHYAQKYQWDFEKEETKSFLKVVLERFD